MQKGTKSKAASKLGKSVAFSKEIKEAHAWNPLATTDVTKPGGTLMGWLLHEASQKGQNFSQMSVELGVTPGYVTQLRNGHRQVHHISQEFAESCARYLGVPPIVVKVAAGKVRALDFVMPDNGEVKFLENGLRRIQVDPGLSGYLPPEAFSAHPKVQHFILTLYQEASGCQIYPASGLPAMMQYLKAAVNVQSEREEAIEDFLTAANGVGTVPAAVSPN